MPCRSVIPDSEEGFCSAQMPADLLGTDTVLSSSPSVSVQFPSSPPLPVEFPSSPPAAPTTPDFHPDWGQCQQAHLCGCTPPLPTTSTSDPLSPPLILVWPPSTPSADIEMAEEVETSSARRRAPTASEIDSLEAHKERARAAEQALEQLTVRVGELENKVTLLQDELFEKDEEMELLEEENSYLDDQLIEQRHESSELAAELKKRGR